jgi:phospholipid-binding lipoprotein MlaA
VFLALLAGGCAASPETPIVEVPAERQFSEFEREGVVYAVDVYDPLEGFNRSVYKFNARFDEFVYLPIVNAYETVTPDYVETRVSNFFANIDSNFFANIDNITTFANSVLQADIEKAVQTFWRFAFNTTVGVLGFFDPATTLEIPDHKEDFGQTLGHWGVGDLGPSNARDATGLAVDTVAFSVVDPFNASSIQTEYPPILVLNVINKRKIQSFRYYETGSPFEYDLVRMLYTKKRKLDIEN